jgi:hypothetical protein
MPPGRPATPMATGSRWGRWTVVGKAGVDSENRRMCRCDCGNETAILGWRLRRGKSRSCRPCASRATSVGSIKTKMCSACGACFRGRKKAQRHCPKCSVLAASLRQEGHDCTPEEYHRRIRAAGGICEACGISGEVMCLDHNHETRRSRGVICTFCNWAEGFFKSDYTRLLRLFDYCIAHQEGNYA